MTTTNPDTTAARISAVDFTNIKGCTARHELAELVAIVAPNGMGKTAISDALQLALTGSHADFGKQGKALMALASGPAMDVAATLTDGRKIARSWRMDAKGSVKATADEPEGWPSADVAMTFNPRTFVALNDRERVATLLRLAGQTTPTTASVEALRDTLEEKASGPKRVTLSDLDPFGPKMADAGAFVEAAEAELVEARKAHKRDIARLEAAVKGLEDASRGATAPVKIEPETVESVAAEVQKLGAEHARLAERHRAAVRLRQRVAEIGDAPEWTAEDDALIVRLGEEVARLAKAEADEAADKEALRRALADGPEPEEVAEANERLAMEVPGHPAMEVAEITAAIAEAKDELATARVRITDLEAEVAKLNGQLGMECCPSCGAAGDDLKARLAETLQPYLETATIRLGNNRQREHDATKRIAELQAMLQDWREHDDALKAITEAREVLARDERVETEAKALRARIDARAEELIDPATGTRPNRADMLAEFTALQQRSNQAKALKDLGEIPSTEDVEALANSASEVETRLAGKQAELSNLKQSLRVWQEFGAQETHIQRMREELEEARTKLATAEELITATRAAGADLAAAIAGPIGEGLRFFTEGVLPGTVKVDAALGIYLETVERGLRPFDAFSGSEKAVVGFALAATLAAHTPLKIALLDEASTMDRARKNAFLARVAEAVGSGRLAQAVVIDHDATAYAAPWQTIAL